MAKTASSNGTALPSSRTAFRRLVAAATTEEQREALADRINAKSSRRDREWLLLEFVRTPHANHDFGFWMLDASQETGWYTLCGLRSPEFARMLRRWMGGRDRDLGALAAKHLTSMAMDEDIPRLVRALRRAPWEVRGRIGRGLSSLARGARPSAEFRASLFDAIAPLVCGEVEAPLTESADEALRDLAEGLVAVDRRAARKLLSGPRALHPGNRAARQVLNVLESEREESSRAPLRVDPGLLWPIFEAVRDGRLRLPASEETNRAPERDRALGVVLSLAADADPARTARECREILQTRKGGSEWLQRAAKEAMRRCRNIPEPDAVLQAHWRERATFRGEALDVVQAYALLDHVLSDGLLAYFGNMGDDWAAAHRGLLAIGQKGAAAIVAEAARIVMAFASAKTRGSVRAAALEMDEAADQKVEALNDRFYTHIDRVRAAVERYIAQHPAAFKAAAPRHGSV